MFAPLRDPSTLTPFSSRQDVHRSADAHSKVDYDGDDREPEVISHSSVYVPAFQEFWQPQRQQQENDDGHAHAHEELKEERRRDYPVLPSLEDDTRSEEQEIKLMKKHTVHTEICKTSGRVKKTKKVASLLTIP